MEKRYFESPKMSVVEIRTDILTASNYGMYSGYSLGRSVIVDGTDADEDGYNDNAF